MKNVFINSTINSINPAVLKFIAEDTETIAQVLSHEDVLDFFTAENADDVLEAIDNINGSITPSSILDRIVVQEGDQIYINLEGKSDDEEGSEGSAPVAAEGQQGTCTIGASAGLQTVVVPVTEGVTTVYDVIFNDLVRSKAMMTDAQLSSCTVMRDELTIDNNSLQSCKVHIGDYIVLTPRVSCSKGLED